MNFFTIIFLLPFLQVGTDFPPIVSEKGGFELVFVEDLELKENLLFQPDNLTRFSFNSDLLVMSSNRPPSVVAYDRQTGYQLFVPGRQGKGPFEYQQIVGVDLGDGRLSVLCLENGLLLFGLNGDGIVQHPSKSPFSKHFSIQDNLLAVQLGFHPEKKFIEIWDLDSEKRLAHLGLGSDDDIWLRSMTHAGGLFFQGQKLVFALADELAVHVYDIKANKQTTHYYANPRYRRYALNASRDQVQEDPMLMINYVLDRSIIANIYPFGDGYVLEIDHRKLEGPFYSELMILNNDFKWIDSIVLEPSFSAVFGENSKAMNDGELLYYKQLSGNQEEGFNHTVSFFEIVNTGR